MEERLHKVLARAGVASRRQCEELILQGRVHVPAAVVGRMVHRAIQRWQFPGDAALDVLLESVAFDEGLVDPGQRTRGIREALRLLQRLREHPLWAEINSAQERHHELPFTRLLPNGRADSGLIDLLYRTQAGWHLVDFKTDELRDQTDLEQAVEGYRPQLVRYARAARELLGAHVDARLCFLDYCGGLHLVTT